jgi:hypothetical protein
VISRCGGSFLTGGAFSRIDAPRQKFGLELHPGKTRLIEFGRFAARDRKRRVRANRRRSTSLGLRIFADNLGRMESSSCCAEPFGSDYSPS